MYWKYNFMLISSGRSWGHVNLVNFQASGGPELEEHLIFGRGYNFEVGLKIVCGLDIVVRYKSL